MGEGFFLFSLPIASVAILITIISLGLKQAVHTCVHVLHVVIADI